MITSVRQGLRPSGVSEAPENPEILQRGIRRREFERFIAELEKLSGAVTEFDEALWGNLVEYVTVKNDKTMVFTMIGGTEIEA